jgi:hypothetical protein
VDDDKRRELRQLLGTLATDRDLQRFSQREREIERSRQVYRFQDLKAEVILPTLRQVMADLERQGHQTRLRAATTEKIRLDIQLQAATVRRGALQIALRADNPSQVQVEYLWGFASESETHPLETMDAGFVADRVLHLLRKLT